MRKTGFIVLKWLFIKLYNYIMGLLDPEEIATK